MRTAVDSDFVWKVREIVQHLWMRSDSANEYVMFGSGVLKLYGIVRVIGDLDFFVTPALYARLRRNHGDCVEQCPHPDDPPFLLCERFEWPVSLFYTWTPRDTFINVPECWYHANDNTGIHAITLELCRQHKLDSIRRVTEEWGLTHKQLLASRWAKHHWDVLAIEAYLA